MSSVSGAVRRLEDALGQRLLNRTTRSVALTQAGSDLRDRLVPLLAALDAALGAVESADGPRGVLRLNVPGAVSRRILPPILAGFLAAHPGIEVDLTVEDGLVDVLAAGADAGIRYGETLAQDMIAVPIGPRRQRLAVAAAPRYVDERGMPAHPRDLLDHRCLRSRFPSGVLTAWEFERGGETVRIDPAGPLTVTTSGVETTIAAAIAGVGVIATFEDWLREPLYDGRLMPVLEDWWPGFEGPFLYFASRRHVPPPLRAFVEYLRRQ